MAAEKYSTEEKSFLFETKAGVFAQYGLDYGSKVLLETINLPTRGNVLDLGCGCGFIGIVIAGNSPKSTVYMVDTDIRAVRLAKQNATRNKTKNVNIKLSDITKDLPDNLKFNLVVSNPPTHQGHEILMDFLKETKNVLAPGGEAYFVVNRMTSVMKRMSEIFGNCEKIKKKNGYIVFKAIKK